MAGDPITSKTFYIHGVTGSSPACAKITIETADNLGNAFAKSYLIAVSDNTPNGKSFNMDISAAMMTKDVRMTLYDAKDNILAQVTKPYSEFVQES